MLNIERFKENIVDMLMENEKICNFLIKEVMGNVGCSGRCELCRSALGDWLLQDVEYNELKLKQVARGTDCKWRINTLWNGVPMCNKVDCESCDNAIGVHMKDASFGEIRKMCGNVNRRQALAILEDEVGEVGTEVIPSLLYSYIMNGQ